METENAVKIVIFEAEEWERELFHEVDREPELLWQLNLAAVRLVPGL